MEVLDQVGGSHVNINGGNVSAVVDTDDPMEAMERQMANGSGAAEAGPRLNGRTDTGREDDDTDMNGEGDEQVMPTRADEFEQEAVREVEVSKGLDGAAADEGKMRLVHQVRHQVGLVLRRPFSPVFPSMVMERT